VANPAHAERSRLADEKPARSQNGAAACARRTHSSITGAYSTVQTKRVRLTIVANSQVLCGSCGALVGLAWTVKVLIKESIPAERSYPRLVVKDCYVVSGEEAVLFCNETCKGKARI